MILYFRSTAGTLFGVGHAHPFSVEDIEKLIWLLGGAKPLPDKSLEGYFVGPRKEMVTPWSTNAVEITQTMGIAGIQRMEEFSVHANEKVRIDPMLQAIYRKSITSENTTTRRALP